MIVSSGSPSAGLCTRQHRRLPVGSWQNASRGSAIPDGAALVCRPAGGPRQGCLATRAAPPAASRQAYGSKSMDWTRSDLLAALHLYLQLPFGQLHRGQARIVQLAGWLRRTPSSVAMKLDPLIVPRAAL